MMVSPALKLMLLSCSSQRAANDDRSISPPPQTNGFKEDDARAQEMAYQTVKRTHLAKVSNPVGDYKDGWQGAKPATT